MPSFRIASAALLLTTAPFTAATAGEVYGQFGLPGLMLGYSQPVSPVFGVRADLATVGRRSDRRTEEGITYDARLKGERAAAFADWFPMAGSFRLTAGVSANDYRLDLAAGGAGGSLTIGNTTYPTSAADRLDVRVKFPSTTPYLGIGWGHGESAGGSGLRVSFDLGAMIGKAKVSAALTGALASRVSQADLDAELAELRENVGKVRAIPQVSLGLGYRF